MVLLSLLSPESLLQSLQKGRTKTNRLGVSEQNMKCLNASGNNWQQLFRLGLDDHVLQGCTT
eukprot:1949622-Alexandrium_andersonii.AAC.1